jgi:molybdenum cofactor cytidylyltransferase
VSATIDHDDVIPASTRGSGSVALRRARRSGQLLVLGYVDHIPIIGAPGCIKSPKTNVIDMILPRLLAGERLTRADLVAMGHSGLLDDIHERPMPRESVLGNADDT